jgi:hypothetical protein
MTDSDLSLALSGRAGDPVRLPSRETFSTQGMNHWLDSPGGQALAAQYGGRAQAAQALAEAERADRAWRREQAADRSERYPDRYPGGVDDAMRDVHAAGGGGAQLQGTEDDIAAAARRADPARPWLVIKGVPDASVGGVSMGPDGRVHTADTRPPWQREG